MLLRFPLHFRVFLRYPMPGIQTADEQADDKQHQRPGMASWMAIVQPDTKPRAEKSGNHHRPADKPHHAQAKPDALRGVTRPEFALRLGANLPAERSSVFRVLDFRIFTHGETLPSGG